MAPLTYHRLLTRLDSLFDALPTQFPHPDDAARLHDVKRAIKSGQISAQRGVEGDIEEILSPGQLKHWVNAKVAVIHDKYDEDAALNASTSSAQPNSIHASTQSAQLTSGIEANQNDGTLDMEDVIESIEQPSPHSDSSKENAKVKREHPATRPTAPPKQSAVTKRIIRGTHTYASVKKTAPKRTRTRTTKPRIASPAAPAAAIASISDREAALALLALFSSSPAIGHEHKKVAAPQLTHLHVPAGVCDAGAAPRDVFLAGVRYAMSNYEYVKSQMNGNGRAEHRGFWDVV